jgi:hypothetical protein
MTEVPDTATPKRWRVELADNTPPCARVDRDRATGELLCGWMALGQIPAGVSQANAMATIHDHPAPFEGNRQSFIRQVI